MVVAGNKTGRLYVLDRDTGRPVFPVVERPTPISDVPGEHSAPTQPASVGLPDLAPTSLAAAEAFGPTPADRAVCRSRIAMTSGHTLFSPPSLNGVIAAPGNMGGPNWSGFSYDPNRNLLLVNTSNLPFFVKVVPPGQLAAEGETNLRGDVSRQVGAPFGMSRVPLFGPSGMPCTPPPWGELLAVDIVHGVIRWRRPLGTMAELGSGLDHEGWGSVSFGGTITTASGLTFIGGTLDRRFRAFDTDTGRLLWSTELPASAHATPMTYEAHGRQFVLIAAGGSAKITEERQSDTILAFALPVGAESALGAKFR